MAVATLTHAQLVKARKGFLSAYAEQDWKGLRYWDEQICERLNNAFDDPCKNSKLLVSELELIVKAYGNMVDVLPQASLEYANSLPL